MNIIPIIPVATDTWTMRFVASSATIARATAPRRSDQGARLKKTHHTTIANAQTKPPIAPRRKALGTTAGRTYLSTHNSTAAATPGHSRSGFRGVGESVGDMGMSVAPRGLARRTVRCWLCKPYAAAGGMFRGRRRPGPGSVLVGLASSPSRRLGEGPQSYDAAFLDLDPRPNGGREARPIQQSRTLPTAAST